jgi:hypothetical protein
MRWFYGGMVLAAVLFVVTPTEKVDEYVRGTEQSAFAAVTTGPWADPPKPLYRKSGLRIAVEGRLAWLGLTYF